MHGLGVACDADVEGSATLYSGDTGVAFDARQVAGSDQTYVFGAFQAKNREFIDSSRPGGETSSPSGTG